MKRTLDAAEPSPVFLSREKRQRLVLEHRQAAIADQRRSALPTLPLPPRDSSSPRQDYQDRHRDRRDRDRNRDRDGREKDRAREKELEAIREQYLGGSKDKKPKTVAKPRDRFRFDWASMDDTSGLAAATNPPAHGALLLYGRGFLAGIDRREQKKAAAAARHKDAGDGAAATYDAIDMRVDAHWTAKRTEEMTERDWRILREDFGISYKGSRVPRPMRSWAESGLGAELLRNVDRAGYRKPTPIQMAAVPLGFQRRDVIGVAQMGSGR